MRSARGLLAIQDFFTAEDAEKRRENRSKYGSGNPVPLCVLCVLRGEILRRAVRGGAPVLSRVQPACLQYDLHHRLSDIPRRCT